MNKIKALFVKYKELITYVVFGVLTTLVNFVCFWALNKIFGDHVYLLNNAIAWIVSVIFAYVTNKLWVFESKSWNIKIVAREVVAFFCCASVQLWGGGRRPLAVCGYPRHGCVFVYRFRI